MSRTRRGRKPPGYEYWSRRPRGVNGYGKIAKWMTKRAERMRDKEIELLAYTDPESVPGRYAGE